MPSPESVNLVGKGLMNLILNPAIKSEFLAQKRKDNQARLLKQVTDKIFEVDEEA